MIPYALIIMAASIALSGVYVFVADTSHWSKGLVVAVLLISFAWRYGLFLRLALAVSLSLYFTYLKSRSERE